MSHTAFASSVRPSAPHTRRAQRFLAGRAALGKQSLAGATQAARRQHLALLAVQPLQPNAVSLSAAWQPVGPGQILTPAYGAVTGRVNALAIDPSDATGNTMYLGTTGGGVWKSTNAAGPAAAVTFTPLTDTLPVFNPNSGASVIPSLSIGAVSVQPGNQNPVVLAGTGDPNDALDSYYGSGILRSADGGSTWTLVQQSQDPANSNHSFIGLGVAGFAWSTTTPGLVVVGLSDGAEGDLVNASGSTSTEGLYYSTDAGITWQLATVTDGPNRIFQTPNQTNQPNNAVTSVVWNPIRSRFYAAVRYHGYYESLDGITWTRLAQQPGTTLTGSACPANPGASGNAACPIFRGTLAVQPVTGDMFALTTSGYYALPVGNPNTDEGLFQDLCSPSGACGSTPVTFAQQLNSVPLEQGSGMTDIPQADYNMALAAVPSVTSGGSPDTLLFVGTSDLFRCSLAAGCALRNTTNATTGCSASAGVAGAQHAIAAIATPSLLFLGNDGGLWRSTDGVDQQATSCSADDATHFQNLNSGLGSLAEIISFAQHPTDPNTLLAGFGANGTAGTSSALSSSTWAQLSPGEGGTVAIDQADPSNWYLSTAPGVSIASCGNGAACTPASFTTVPTIGLTQVSDDGVLSGLSDPPWLLDPTAPTELVIGTCRVWRGPATNAASWNPSNAISPLLSGPQNSSCDTGNSLVRSLAASGPTSGAAAAQNAGSTVLYAGMAGALTGGGSAGGHLFTTTTGGTASSSVPWTDLTTSPVTNGGTFNPDGFDVSSVSADPHDATGKTVYATVMGFGVARLYRSTDAGAHWSNISGNLPNAPANSVVVDPADANTVYVALDTGVYVTQQVATCAATNCWSVYGTGLPNAPVVALAASASIALHGSNGALRAATYGRGIWQLPLLTTSVPTSQAAITLSPTALTFTPQQVATLSASQTITVTNTGNASLTVNSVIVSGDFTQTNTCVGSAVAASSTCTVQVAFAPAAVGARTGLLTVYGNIANGQATAALTGTGTTGSSIVLTPLTLTFPATTTGATSAAQNITISNTAATAATLQSETVSGDFHISANTCGATLGPSTGCTVAIVFTPTASGARSGSLTVVDGAGTQIASLNGAGTSPATDALNPNSLTFAAQVLNTTSATQQVSLTNAGDVALTLVAAQITSGDFTVVNYCGNSLNAHSTCALQVAFVPKKLGTGLGLLTVSDQYRAQTVSLSGTGIAPAGVTLAPFGALSFGALGVGLTSTPQTVTLTNNGGVAITSTAFAASGDFTIVAGTNTCGASLAVNAVCTLQVDFKPTAAAARSGTLTLSSSLPTPQTLPLTGSGVDFSLTASNSAVTVASGTAAVYGLLLSSASGVPGTAVFTCASAPVHATCLVVPSTVPLGTGTATVTVTVATGVATAALAPTFRTFWLAGLLPLGLLFLRKRRSLSLLLLVVGAGLSLVSLSGCGASRTVPPTTTSPTNPTAPNPTPSGSSTIVVSATSAGLTRSVNLTLTVQ